MDRDRGRTRFWALPQAQTNAFRTAVSLFQLSRRPNGYRFSSLDRRFSGNRVFWQQILGQAPSITTLSIMDCGRSLLWRHSKRKRQSRGTRYIDSHVASSAGSTQKFFYLVRFLEHFSRWG